MSDDLVFKPIDLRHSRFYYCPAVRMIWENSTTRVYFLLNASNFEAMEAASPPPYLP